MRIGLQGWYTDLVADGHGTVLLATPRTPNLIAVSSLDLIGNLLSRPGTRGLTFFAIGEGDSTWDQALPTPPVETRQLQKEVYRQALHPDADFKYDAATSTLTVSFTFGDEAPHGPFREWGIFGGDASALAGSGTLFAYRAHAKIDRPQGGTLARTWTLSLAKILPLASARAAIASLLSGAPGFHGIQTWAMGSGDEAWDAQPPAADPSLTALTREVYRRPLRPVCDISYDSRTHTLAVQCDLEYNEAKAVLRESALLGGLADDTLLVYQTHPKIDNTVPRRLHRVVRIPLASAQELTIPDVAGKTRAQAIQALHDAGFAVAQVIEVEDNANPGQVMDTDPPANTKAPPLSLVALRVRVPIRVPVPYCVGFGADDATQAVKTAGLVPVIEIFITEPSRAGVVLRQNPLPGERIPKGSNVTLVVATQPVVQVPDLKGLNQAEALTILSRSGLLLNDSVGAAPSDEFPGSIISQDPAAGVAITRGSLVSVTLAAVRTVKVPDLTGMTREEAGAALAASGNLTLGASSIRESTQKPGTIVEQDPPASTEVPVWRTVAIVIAAPQAVTVPDLTGTDRAAAISALTAGRLQAGKITDTVSSSKLGTVIRQSPAAGYLAAAGATVDLAVATPVLLEVPQVTGLISALAKESIETRGLTLGDPVTQVSAAAEGTVLDQNPRAGEKLGVGGKVVLTIAGAVAVPSVINQTLTQAKAALDQLGLALEIRNRPLSDRPLDTVLDQAPKPPAKVPRGAVIQLDVSTGVPVPAVHGIDRASAKQQIEAAQLKFAEARSVPSDRPAGTVLELSPDQGVVVPLNTTVNVTVAVGVEVPDVVRAVLVNGRKTLETAGFQVQVTGDPDSDAIVQSQDPPAHKFIPLGAMVAVVSALENLVTVPGLIGQREAAAKDLCTRAALQMNVISRGISSEPEGAVFSQDPEAAKKVRRNSVVSVRVSTGQLTPPRRPPIDVHLPDPLPRPPVVSPRLPPVVIGRLGISALGVAQVEVPNVTGKGLTQAQQELDARGLKHSVTRVRHALAPDTVVDQTPRANDSAPRNSQVALVVSNGPL